MKRVLKYVSLLFAMIIVVIGLDHCLGKNAAEVDVVNGIKPFDVHNIEWRKAFIAKLKPLTPAQRKEEIDKVLPYLNGSLMNTVRKNGYDCDVKTVTYVFGSGTAKKVASGDGKQYDGYFNDQLYAVVKGDKCFKDSLMLFVACFNGVFTIENNKDNQVIGTYEPSFTIEKNWGLNHYVDYQTSIWIARYFNIPIYIGKNMDKMITPDRALELEDSVAYYQIAPKVFPGDHFDLGTMKYTKAKP
jgi:hypothetical protein